MPAPQPEDEQGTVYYVTTPVPGTDVRPCTGEDGCPVPPSIFHFHCYINKTIIFNSMDDFKAAAANYIESRNAAPPAPEDESDVDLIQIPDSETS